MDVFELFPFLRRAPEPEMPADTLPAITQQLNGGSGDPIQVSQAIAQLLNARSRWTAHKQELDVHLQKLVAEGAPEKTRRPVRDALSRAREEISLLEAGEEPLRRRLVKARADLIHARRHHEEEALAAELKPIMEALMPLMDRAVPIVERVNRGEINVDPQFIQSVLPALALITGHFVEKRSHFESALRVLARQPLLRPQQHPDSNPSGRPRFEPPPPKPRMTDTQHPVTSTVGPLQVLSLPAGAAPRPRKADDLSPLEPGEMRVKVIRAGYETPDGQQCDLGQVVKLPARVAQKAIGNSAVAAVEMNIDRTDVKGADWQGADPGASLTIIGSGGTSITQIDPGNNGTPAPASAPAEQGDTK